jgi:hypothetical protein
MQYTIKIDKTITIYTYAEGREEVELALKQVVCAYLFFE